MKYYVQHINWSGDCTSAREWNECGQFASPVKCKLSLNINSFVFIPSVKLCVSDHLCVQGASTPVVRPANNGRQTSGTM